MARPRDEAYDRFMLEQFQLQKNPNEVFKMLNYQQFIKEEKPVVSRAKVYRRYNQWVKEGRIGALEFVEIKVFDDTIVSYWRSESKRV